MDWKQRMKQELLSQVIIRHGVYHSNKEAKWASRDQQKAWLRLWRKWNLLGEISISAATMENSVEVPLKTENRTLVWLSNLVEKDIQRIGIKISKCCLPTHIHCSLTTVKA